MPAAQGAPGAGCWSPPLAQHAEHLAGRRLAVAHWNASHFGALRSVAQRHTQNRRYFVELLESTEEVGVIETRGAEADLLQLPRSHAYVGIFLPEVSPGTSSATGAVIAVKRDRADRATKVHAKGRATSETLHLAVNLSLAAVHLDPARSTAAQTRLVSITAQRLQRIFGIKFVSGDWSFTSQFLAKNA